MTAAAGRAETGADRESLIVALDVGSAEEALPLARLLAPATRFFKVGSVLFSREGPALVGALVSENFQVFLDLKFHDIPDVVAQAVANAAGLGVSMLTLHAGGGESMMQTAAAALARRSGPRPLLLAVTVLTSFTPQSWERLFPGLELTESVQRLAGLAHDSGMDGVVCSPWELGALSTLRLKKVVPGIRPPGDAPGDQRRVMTPGAAIAAGADYLVVGRPITRAADPLRAALAVAADMRSQGREEGTRGQSGRG